MGGDEFVIVAPGLSLHAAAARGVCLSEMATAAGRTVCGEDLLSLSVGCAVFPNDGSDAEKLLAEADRRMYSEKQQHYSEKQAVLHSLPAIKASLSAWIPSLHHPSGRTLRRLRLMAPRTEMVLWYLYRLPKSAYTFQF